jgi:hypothetical protein
MTTALTFTVARFSGSYRRRGCNWAVWRGRFVACDQMGNPWGFHRRQEAEEYLKDHTPEFWVEEFETPGTTRKVYSGDPIREHMKANPYMYTASDFARVMLD